MGYILITYSKALVLREAFYLLNVVAVQNECLQIGVLVNILDFVD